MSVALHTNLAAVGRSLIDTNGRDITVIKLGQTPADSSKPWRGATNPRATPEASITLKGTFVELGDATRLGIIAEGSDILKRISKVVMALPTTETSDLEEFDEILDTEDSKRYGIEQVQRLKPGTVTMLYYFMLRR